MSNTVIAGKPSNTVGEKDSTLVLRGRSIKIQWGNKFIDLIKNGKINVDADKILKTADSVEGITSDGIYLVGESVWAVIGGTKIQIAGDSATTYVSYLVAQETTPEQKNQALTNIGFYYDTYEQAQNAGLTTGIVYVQGDNKLYVVKDGVLTEYITTSTSNNTSDKETPMEKLYISEYSLMVDGEEYITCDGDIKVHKKLVLEDGLMSNGATSSFGYRLYTQYGESYLEVDNLIVRNTTPDKVSIYPIKYYQEENIILSAVDSENTNQLQLTLLQSDKYKVGDILTTSILLDNEVEITDEDGEIETITEQVLTSIDFKIESTEDNKTYIVSTEFKNLDSNVISSLVNKSIFYKKGQLPVARIKDHNYDLFEANSEQELENVNTRLGSLQELTIDLLGEQISKYTNKDLGIYSDNAVFKKPQLINPEIYISETEQYDNITTKIGYIAEIPIGNGIISNYSNIDLGIYSDNAFLKDARLFSSIQYNTEFRNLNGTYPKYAEGWYIPSNSNDQTIVTSKWVQDRLSPIKTDINNIKKQINIIKDDIESLEERVTNNEEEIESLKDQIADLESGGSGDLTSITNRVSKLEDAVETIQDEYVRKDEFEDLLNQYLNIVNGDFYNPVILISGTITKNSYGQYIFSGNKKEAITSISTSTLNGLMTVSCSSSKTINITSSQVSQYYSGYTNSLSNTTIREDGVGAHWFETRHSGGSIYIREFHQYNDANHSWASDTWSSSNAIASINITVFGYITE